MPIIVEFFDSEPIVHLVLVPPLDPLTDIPHAVEAYRNMLARHPGLVYVVVDVTQTPLTLDMTIDGLGAMRNQVKEGERLQFVIIGSGELLQKAAEWLTQKQYGGYSLPRIVASEAEAFAFIRQEIKKG